jgi:LEA14-like dessication related protein
MPEGRRAWLVLAGFVALALTACSGLGWESVFERPRVRVTGLDVTHVTLRDAGLRFDFAVENPNPIAVPLGGIDYELRVNGERVLDGLVGQALEIAARGETPVSLPLTVRFADLARAWGSVRQRDRSRYELAADFLFDVPVVGRVRVPVRRDGDLPSLQPGG